MFTLNISLFLDSVLIFALAFLIDLVFGEYPDRIHPTIGIGKLILYLKGKAKSPNPRLEKTNGVLMALTIMLVVALPVFVAAFLVKNASLRRNTLHNSRCNPVQSNLRD